MGIRDQSIARRAGRLVTVAALALAVGAAGAAGACAGDDDSETSAPSQPLEAEPTSTPESTARPLCAEARHLVVLDVFGTLTLSDDDLEAWAENPNEDPPVRLGAADLTTTYRELGYELLYVTTATGDMTLGGVPIPEALTGWLDRNGLPSGEGTRIWTWDARGNGMVAMVDELLRLGGSGVTTDAGYTDNPEVVRALSSGGVSPDALYTLGEAAGTAGTVTLAGDDLEAQATAVGRQPMICQP